MHACGVCCVNHWYLPYRKVCVFVYRSCEYSLCPFIIRQLFLWMGLLENGWLQEKLCSPSSPTECILTFISKDQWLLNYFHIDTSGSGTSYSICGKPVCFEVWLSTLGLCQLYFYKVKSTLVLWGMCLKVERVHRVIRVSSVFVIEFDLWLFHTGCFLSFSRRHVL
jgi:hypothetical protein